MTNETKPKASQGSHLEPARATPKLTMWTKVTAKDGFLAWIMWPAAVLFALFTFATAAALASGVKDHEVVVATLYTIGCGAAFVTSSASLAHSIAWVPLFSLTASLSGTIVFFLEADLRLEQNKGSALLIITVPLMIGVLAFGAFLHARRRRQLFLAKVPSAQVHLD